VPLIGIFIMAAWTIPGAWAQWPRPGFVFSTVVAGVLMFLLAGTEVQLQYWRNSVTLFSHTTAVTQNSILAEYNLGEALARQGDPEQAIIHYQRALAIQPNRVEALYNPQRQAHYNLGLIFRSQKKWAAAETQFREFVRNEPDKPGGHWNLGVALVALNRMDEALEEFRETIRTGPPAPDNNEEIEIMAWIESAYAEAGRLSEAISTAQKIHDTALAEGRKDLADAAEKRIESYRAGKL
jgi:tetratricopeptide (TPR) repeat protein